jgi:uroporphyrinogen decarboxylase
MSMTNWLNELRKNPVKKAMPVLSFPSVQLLGISVRDLIFSSDLQSRGMKAIANRTDSAASVGMMDLSVEAEAFGAEIRISDDEVPTVIGCLIETEEQAAALQVPKVGSGRTGIYIEAIEKACKLITDRPVFSGVIGPFSLSGRLLDVSEIMLYCYDEPELVHNILTKATHFIIEYAEAFKSVGANGLIIAEPLAGLLTPAFNDEFSAKYVKEIVDTLRSDNFAVIYHNCGGGTPKMTEAILSTGADAYHFGNAIDIIEILRLFPYDALVMGNIDPASQFRNGTPLSIRSATLELLERCREYPNFVISSGCDIPPMSSWDNIDAFFGAVRDFNELHDPAEVSRRKADY